MIHLSSFGFLPGEGAKQKRNLRKSAPFSAVRWSRGVSRTFGAMRLEAEAHTTHGRVGIGDSLTKTDWVRRTSLRRICVPDVV